MDLKNPNTNDVLGCHALYDARLQSADCRFAKVKLLLQCKWLRAHGLTMSPRGRVFEVGLQSVRRKYGVTILV